MQLSQGQIKRLGKRLSTRDDESFPDAVAAYVDYSLSYLPILKAITDSLWEAMAREPEVASRDIRIGARLKQVRSVSAKLRRLSSGLSGMQDLAGCRVVVPDLWDQAVVTNIAQQLFLVKSEFDYRKDDNKGYRGRHLVLRGFTHAGELPVEWPSRVLVELQVRTELQDLWANVSELHGKYSASEHHKDQLQELSETLWRLDQMRLALRIASEERQLLRAFTEHGSPIQAVVQAWRDGVGELYRVPKSQEDERRSRIADALELVPTEEIIGRHGGTHSDIDAKDVDPRLGALKGLQRHVQNALLGHSDAHRSMTYAMYNGVEPGQRQKLRTYFRRIRKRTDSILCESPAVRKQFEIEPSWIDRLPRIKAALRDDLVLGSSGYTDLLVSATMQDVVISWFGVCRTCALVTAIVPPLNNGARGLGRLAEDFLRRWSDEDREVTKGELRDWASAGAELKDVVRDYVPLVRGESQVAAGNPLASRWNGVMGHFVGLQKLHQAFGRMSEAAEYSALRSWIEQRDQVGGNQDMGPKDLEEEIKTQVKVDGRLLRQTLRAELGGEQLSVWELHPQAMSFSRFLKSGSALKEGRMEAGSNRLFCVVLRDEGELTGEIAGRFRDHEEAGRELKERTAELLTSISDGTMALEGEAIVMYTEPKLDHIETHLRYFMDAREMVERIMEDQGIDDDVVA